MHRPCSHLAIDLISELLERRTGLLFQGERRERLETHVTSICEDRGVQGAEELFALLHDRDVEGRALFAQLVEEATVNHTAFFREMAGFSHIPKLLPQLADEPEVRVWSAASATGEELYTLVLLLAELLGFAELRTRWKFLGTDINPSVIAQAEQGVYTEGRVMGVPPELRNRYFDRVGDVQYRISPQVRSLCTFRQFNLARAPYPFKRGFHLVFCRNVLYYFCHSVQERVLNSIHAATDERGWLVTGVSETIDQLETPWERKAMCLYRRTGLVGDDLL
ncbi:MAG: protein-glutamate O-methyltransferase CheR [Nannocystaceae bacterium]|nr:protein-glutamate O-methyltransferase CheR [Nannocystaceae bacterium]